MARPPRGVPAGELRELTTEGVDVLGASAARLREQLAELTTVFNSELGLTPKAVSRLMRCEHARQHMTRASSRGVPPDIAATAHACGYSDHAHLVHDFRQYVGTSPTRWLAEERRNIQAGAHRDGEDWDA